MAGIDTASRKSLVDREYRIEKSLVIATGKIASSYRHIEQGVTRDKIITDVKHYTSRGMSGRMNYRDLLITNSKYISVLEDHISLIEAYLGIAYHRKKASSAVVQCYLVKSVYTKRCAELFSCLIEGQHMIVMTVGKYDILKGRIMLKKRIGNVGNITRRVHKKSFV